ncbi:hypothetical protein AWENTII_011182 [Aspergillus wentii]
MHPVAKHIVGCRGVLNVGKSVGTVSLSLSIEPLPDFRPDVLGLKPCIFASGCFCPRPPFDLASLKKKKNYNLEKADLQKESNNNKEERKREKKDPVVAVSIQFGKSYLSLSLNLAQFFPF